MSDYVLRIFEKYPRLVVDLKKDLLDFISDRNNVGEGREEVRKSGVGDSGGKGCPKMQILGL